MRERDGHRWLINNSAVQDRNPQSVISHSSRVPLNISTTQDSFKEGLQGRRSVRSGFNTLKNNLYQMMFMIVSMAFSVLSVTKKIVRRFITERNVLGTLDL